MTRVRTGKDNRKYAFASAAPEGTGKDSIFMSKSKPSGRMFAFRTPYTPFYLWIADQVTKTVYCLLADRAVSDGDMDNAVVFKFQPRDENGVIITAAPTGLVAGGGTTAICFDDKTIRRFDKNGIIMLLDGANWYWTVAQVPTGVQIDMTNEPPTQVGYYTSAVAKRLYKLDNTGAVVNTFQLPIPELRVTDMVPRGLSGTIALGEMEYPDGNFEGIQQLDTVGAGLGDVNYFLELNPQIVADAATGNPLGILPGWIASKAENKVYEVKSRAAYKGGRDPALVSTLYKRVTKPKASNTWHQTVDAAKANSAVANAFTTPAAGQRGRDVGGNWICTLYRQFFRISISSFPADRRAAKLYLRAYFSFINARTKDFNLKIYLSGYRNDTWEIKDADWSPASDIYLGSISTTGWAEGEFRTIDVTMDMIDSVLAQGDYFWVKLTSEDEENDVYPAEPSAGSDTWELLELDGLGVVPTRPISSLLIWD